MRPPQSATLLDSQLAEAQHQLTEQAHRLELVLSAQERERRALAGELQDRAAQTLAAIQVGLRALERDVDSEASRTQIAEMRAQLADTLRLLRTLAVDLWPPVLDHLGLEPALHGLVARAQVRSGQEISLEVSGIEDRLPTHIETAVYRIVGELVRELDTGVHLRAQLGGDHVELILTSSAPGEPVSLRPAALGNIQASLSMLGGAIAVHGPGLDEFSVEIPLAAGV